jgi:hypothetical protein
VVGTLAMTIFYIVQNEIDIGSYKTQVENGSIIQGGESSDGENGNAPSIAKILSISLTLICSMLLLRNKIN